MEGNISHPISLTTVFTALTRERLHDLARVFGVQLDVGRQRKQAVVEVLAAALSMGRLLEVLEELGRDELRTVCRSHGLSDSGRARADLIERLAEVAGTSALPVRTPPAQPDGVPAVGQILNARGRQWLVEDVVLSEDRQSPLLRLACLDDDAPGRKLEMLWQLELGARVMSPEAAGLEAPSQLDAPSDFAAYLNALQWSAVSSADPSIFQAPFRAGIKIMAHQLTPLMKALELPRANLFIADDVGLGKTIEAGLVLQELILRQQADFVLIVCPASICLQWRDEMMRRFGLRFEVMSRQLVAQRRIARGFGVNPWATHHRFIVSHPVIRRPEYRDPLLAHLGHRAEKGLLILDEAHVAAPAAASKYAVDSDITRTIRDLAPKFDNRLFLSATPHNGHSNSFSALLEILDPVRFTRGVEIRGADHLAPVMVRRLKRDLSQLGFDKFPRRILVRLDLEHRGDGGWRVFELRRDAEEPETATPRLLAERLGGDDLDLQMARLLERYGETSALDRGRGRLVFTRLQQRLLSSPEAFARTLEVHARAREGNDAEPTEMMQEDLALDSEIYGRDDDTQDVTELAEIATESRRLGQAEAAAATLLRQLRGLAEEARKRPDAKARALMAWLRQHACAAIDDQQAEDRSWSARRVLIFTEYRATQTYLLELLSTAVAHTERGEERIMTFLGGMGDDARDEVQRAFNTPPDEHPVRILVATDAAREGVNLQAHCADLFHFDVPWNPSRMEQRNGRLDRTLQPADEVRCHYFVYPQRPADRVLETLVRKIDTVQRELGSVGAVVLDAIEKRLERGFDAKTAEDLEKLHAGSAARRARQELEAQRQLDRLRNEVERASQRLERSRRRLEVAPDALRAVVETGLRLSGAAGLQEAPADRDGVRTFLLPELDRGWQPVLDTLRPPRTRDESFWEWRSKAPRPVTFEPLSSLTQKAQQLHLAHPVMRRILDRFLAQGYSAHDLSRVCAVVVPNESVPRAVAYARLTLFGRGAARLHDEVLAIASPWPLDSSRVATVEPYKDATTATRARRAIEEALSGRGSTPGERVVARARAEAPKLFAALWPHLEAEADALAVAARNALGQRARKESEDLVRLLRRQEEAIDEARVDLDQLVLPEVRERRQVELDIKHLDHRRRLLACELESEPAKIEALYEVRMMRLTPVGLVLAWPEAMSG